MPTIERVAGWRRALIAAGKDPDHELLVRAAFGWVDGYRSGVAMLSGADRPDAVFVASDEQAIGMLKAAAELGLSVPDDLAICAFDGVEPSAYTVPGLSTMRQPLELIGRSAVEWILAKIADPTLPPTRIIHDTALVARGSCGCPDLPKSERIGTRY
jgi:LacI family transcriptional regulator